MKATSSIIVLGSKITSPPSQEPVVSHRLHAAWKAYMGIKSQLMMKHTPHHQKLALMDAVLLPSLLWGMESVAMLKPQRRRLDAFQRTIVGRMLRVAQRGREERSHFFRRRERCITAAIQRYARGHWGGETQKYRYFNFRGHVERMGPHHDVQRVTRWRNDEWWETYKVGLPAKTGGQQERRPPDRSNPCREEAPLRKALQNAMSREWWPPLERALRGAGLRGDIAW